MKELQIFNNPAFGEIRAVELGGAPWFAAGGEEKGGAGGWILPPDVYGSMVFRAPSPSEGDN